MRTSTKDLRNSLATFLAQAALVKEIIVTQRGKPYVRLTPAKPVTTLPSTTYPLRGTLLALADDFEAPTADLWNALQ